MDATTTASTYTEHGIDDDDDFLMVNYQDVCIYRRDYQLFCSPTSWLNDACIHYQWMRLLDRYNNDNKTDLLGHVVLMDPAVVAFVMHQCETDEELRDDFLPGFFDGFPRRRRGKRTTTTGFSRIFVPINDSMSPASGRRRQSVERQGSHWSLMILELTKGTNFETNDTVVRRPDDDDGESRIKIQAAYHCDSISYSGNLAAACAVATKLAHALSLSSSSSPPQHHQTTEDSKVVPIVVQECVVPQQRNGYDCGMHVLATVEALLFDETVHDTVHESCASLLKSFEIQPGVLTDLRRAIAMDIEEQAAIVCKSLSFGKGKR